MFSKKAPAGASILVAVSSALVAGLIVSIGLVQAAGDGPVGTASAAPGEQVEVRPPVEADRRPETSVAAAADVARRSLAAVNAFDPAGRERPRPAFDRLVLVGDSLADEAAPVIRYLTPQLEFVRRYWGGTAPCDWIDDGLEATPTTVVVISFIGNNSTDCMLAGTGVQPIDETLVERYRTDIAVLIDQATTAGAWVVLVGQPPRHPRFETDVEVAGINEVYREYAAAMPRVSFVDAGHLVETPDGEYTDRLPCIELDTDCAPDGTTVVRGDGVHFCPVIGVNPCTVWSSGAFRFGMEIVSAANDPARLD